MTNPTTHTTTTSTTTTTSKPTAMEKVKEKATQIADKLTGKQHDPNHSNVYHDSNQPGPGFHGNDNLPTNTGNTANAINPAVTYHAGQHPVDALNTTDRHHNQNNQTAMPPHTGAAVGNTAVPHGNTAGHQGLTGHSGPTVPPKDDHHHGIFSGLHHDKHDKRDTNALGGTQAADPNLIHPSVVPHQQTTAGLQNPGATNVAGPTGTSHVPTYTQNVPPTAAGTVPVVGQTAEQVHPSSGGGLMGNHHDRHNQAHIQNTMATTTAAGTQVPPMNTNNNTAPGGAVPQNVPAMGAPGTTTAAGTHMPGQYVS
ncbi:hypothetical protein BG015_006949 [Linnemannia schmuckeri]|uniref:Uncharacterized protein n=1 Tax=Linnemannia schmuckeri TaxID=64567 RepID=A0A9P5VBN8_9FUNG|nr:hypothetical protein BG015_006949 [Linnemannia schmuckeri]